MAVEVLSRFFMTFVIRHRAKHHPCKEENHNFPVNQIKNYAMPRYLPFQQKLPILLYTFKIPNLLLAKLPFRLSKKRFVHTHLFRKYSEFFQGLSSAILVFLFSYSLTKVISEKLLHN